MVHPTICVIYKSSNSVDHKHVWSTQACDHRHSGQHSLPFTPEHFVCHLTCHSDRKLLTPKVWLNITTWHTLYSLSHHDFVHRVLQPFFILVLRPQILSLQCEFRIEIPYPVLPSDPYNGPAYDVVKRWSTRYFFNIFGLLAYCKQ